MKINNTMSEDEEPEIQLVGMFLKTRWPWIETPLRGHAAAAFQLHPSPGAPRGLARPSSTAAPTPISY